MHKLRVCIGVFALVVIVVHWWRNERPRSSIALPSTVTSIADPFPSGSGSSPAMDGGGAPTLSAEATGRAVPDAPAGARTPGLGSASAVRSADGPPSGLTLEGAAARPPAPAPAGGAAPSAPRDGRRPAEARPGAIAGTARDISGALLPGVEVQVRGPALGGGSRTTRTGSGGAYRVPDLPEGTYTVTFVRPRYEPSTRTVRVRSAQVAEGVTGILTPRRDPVK